MQLMNLPLEDLVNDVIAKAQRGLGLRDESLAAQAGVSVDAVRAVKEGTLDEATIIALAAPLKLHAAALTTMARQLWRPAPVQLEGLAQFNTTWHDMTVNAYVVWDPQTRQAAAFDTGAMAQPMIEFIRSHQLHLSHLFLTHTHPDHVADIAALRRAGGKVEVFANERESVPEATTFHVGTATWKLGALTIEARNTHGHSKGGTTYVVTGLAKPLAIVGDALFASSMGGGVVSFADALATNRKEIFSLPDETVV